jgi:nitroreductase
MPLLSALIIKILNAGCGQTENQVDCFKKDAALFASSFVFFCDYQIGKETDMEFKELVTKNRSYRRYDQSHLISKETLQALVELAKYCPSAANRQSLRFIGSILPEKNQEIFNTLGWAAYLPEWPGPPDGQRPTGYIIILADPSEWKWVMADIGIVAQTILLEAVNRGLGGCMIGNIKKKALHDLIGMPDGLEAVLVIALGKPMDRIVIESVSDSKSIKYYHTEDGVHHVPKRNLQELLLEIYV